MRKETVFFCSKTDIFYVHSNANISDVFVTNQKYYHGRVKILSEGEKIYENTCKNTLVI